MDYRKFVILGAFFASASASAGYAQLAPPPGWSPGSYAPSANDASYGRVIYSPNGPTTTVGGQAVKMPAAYRLAANAPRIAAAAIFMHPYVRGAAAIATWLGLAGLAYNVGTGLWERSTAGDYPVSDAYRYTFLTGYPWYNTGVEACNAYGQIAFPNYAVVYVPSGTCNFVGISSTQTRYLRREGNATACPAGWYSTPAGCVSTPPPKTVTQQEFEDALAPKPMPERVPQELPQPTPLPIETPSPWINPDPGASPQHKPFFVPNGNPVPNPNFDPNSPVGPNNQPYIQPGTKIQPSPTASQPWRVDFQPVNRPQNSPEPKPDQQEDDGTGDKAKSEDEQTLCERHPDIIACQKLEMPEKVSLESKAVDFDFTPESGFSGAAVCPAPIMASIFGYQLAFSWQGLCDSLSLIKPLLLAMAWLSAAFILLGRNE